MTELDELSKEALEKIKNYVPADKVHYSVTDQLNNRTAPESVRLETLELAYQALYNHSRRQGKRRMTRYAGTGKVGHKPYIDNPNEGAHYPAVQSIMQRIRNYLARQLVRP